MTEGRTIEELRRAHYNATVIGVRLVHEELMILRVIPDAGVPRFRAGQYTTLGLGYWEPRVPDTQPEQLVEADLSRVVRRAYSISFPLLDEAGRLISLEECPFLEFYVVLVREAPGVPPALTPRLFCLREGDRLHVGTKVVGSYTLASVTPRHDVVFLATGTGEAPHNAMLAELLSSGHAGGIINAVCVRKRSDLGYLEAHRRLERLHGNYHYLVLTTREPENLDPAQPGFVAKQYLQKLIESDQIEQRLGHPLEPGRAQFFLCGNPAMIGIPSIDEEGRHVYPKPTGVVELLERRGFRTGGHGQPGDIHFEKYW